MKIVILVEGGLVQKVYASNKKAEVVIVDMDLMKTGDYSEPERQEKQAALTLAAQKLHEAY